VISPAVANCQLAPNPRRPVACSERKLTALPNSPPTENPCNRRAMVTIKDGIDQPTGVAAANPLSAAENGPNTGQAPSGPPHGAVQIGTSISQL
jgi:hypothetical protein